MASMDGPCEVWYWLLESVYGTPRLDEAAAKSMVDCFTDEEQAYIIYALESYDEDNHNWRDYRNSLWYNISELSEARFDARMTTWVNEQAGSVPMNPTQ